MSDGLAKGYDWWFRRGQATIAGTQEGKRNEMIHDTLVETQRQSGDLTAIREALTSNNGSSAVVESNREMLRAQERAREESSRLAEIQFQQQTQIANNFQGLSDDISGFREDFRAVSVREHQMAAERNQFLSDIVAENHQQTGVMMDMNRNMVDGMNHVGERIDGQTKDLMGVAPRKLSYQDANANVLTLIALQQQGALSSEGHQLLQQSNVARLARKVKQAESELQQAQEQYQKSSSLDDGYKHIKQHRDDCERRLTQFGKQVSSLSGDVATAFKALHSGMQLSVNPNSISALRTLAAGHALNPVFHTELMKRDPESRISGGITGLNITAIETNSLLRQGFGVISAGMSELSSTLSTELGLQREVIVESTQFLAETFVTGLSTLDSNIQQGFSGLQTSIATEGHLTREAIVQSNQVIGAILQSGFSSLSGTISSGFSRMNTRLERMTEVFSHGLSVISEDVRNGFFAVSEQISREGVANRETALKVGEYVAKITLTGFQVIQEELSEGFQVLDKRAQYANYLSEILVQEAVKSNGLLNGIENELMVLNRNVLEGRAEEMLQHAQLLDALSYYDQNAGIRHQENQAQLMRIENVLVGIKDGIEQVRDGVGAIGREIATKELWLLDQYKYAESLRELGKLEKSIEVYEGIVTHKCPQHYASHVALVDCYLLIKDFDKAMEHAIYAQASARSAGKGHLEEEAHMIEFGMKYVDADRETDAEKKQRMYAELIQFFESLKLQDGLSSAAKLFYFGVLYKMGIKEKALKGLAEIMRVDRFAVFDMRNVSPLEDFFKGDHLTFFKKEVLQSNITFPSEVYMYMFRLYEAAQDVEGMKLALKKAVEKRPSACMEAKIFNSPMVQESLMPDFIESIQNNHNTEYWGVDLIAAYYLAKRFNMPFTQERRHQVIQELEQNIDLVEVASLFYISIMLSEDFIHFYQDLYSKIH